MHFKGELAALAERMLPEELLDRILSAYREELEREGCPDSERDYAAGRQALEAALDEGQRAQLASMEEMGRRNLRYALRFGFHRGVYSAFGQRFSEAVPNHLFHILVENELLTQPCMQKYEPYYTHRLKLNAMYAVLREQLSQENGERLLSVYTAWDERLYGVLRYAFYLGFRHAVEIVGEVEPLKTAGNVAEGLLKTEYELGFLRTLMEQEERA